MEDRTFDRISRAMAGTSSRRQALKLLGGGIAGGALASSWANVIAKPRAPLPVTYHDYLAASWHLGSPHSCIDRQRSSPSPDGTANTAGTLATLIEVATGLRPIWWRRVTILWILNLAGPVFRSTPWLGVDNPEVTPARDHGGPGRATCSVTCCCAVTNLLDGRCWPSATCATCSPSILVRASAAPSRPQSGQTGGSIVLPPVGLACMLRPGQVGPISHLADHRLERFSACISAEASCC